jgi:transposase
VFKQTKKKPRKNAKKREEERKRTAVDIQINHDIPESERRCPACPNQELKPAGSKSSVLIEWVPGHFERQTHVQASYACPCCDHIVTADGPQRPTEGGQYGAGFMSHVVVSKCADCIPLYRMEKQFRRIGIPISRSTLCDLFHQAAELLTPLYQRMAAYVAGSLLVLADETSLQVIDRSLDKTRKGYVWIFLTDDVAYYRFSPTRSGETPGEVLGDSPGTLLVDGYTGYNQVITPDSRDRAGCWAHVRRKFFDALSFAPEEAKYMLDQILNLYRVEYEAVKREITGKPIHQQLRMEKAGPILAHIQTWAEEQKLEFLPKSPMGEALSYMLNQWKPLNHYLTDAKIPIDNNGSERSLRLIAKGRDNYMFAGSDAAAQNLAQNMSLVVSCDLHGVNPEAYLADVLIRIQTHPAKNIDDLLPRRWKELFAPGIPNSTFELS